MGLYDYDPEKQSPGDYTACELAFHAGDILFVYGNERPDGFFHGEVGLRFVVLIILSITNTSFSNSTWMTKAEGMWKGVCSDFFVRQVLVQ